LSKALAKLAHLIFTFNQVLSKDCALANNF
jgi:hypothetical protein